MRTKIKPMKLLRSFLPAISLCLASCAATQSAPDLAQNTCWFRTADHADLETVELGPGGVIAAVGSFAGQLDLGPGIPKLTAPEGNRVFVTHVAPNGSTGWAKVIGNSGGAAAFAANGDLLVMAAATDPEGSHCLVQRLRAQDGAPLWRTQLTIQGEKECRVLAVGPDDALYISASWNGTLAIPGQSLKSVGPFDILLARMLASDGAITWLRTYGGSGNAIARAIAIDPSGAVVIGGQFGGQFGDDGSVGTGNITIGESVLHSVGYFDGLLAKFSPNGDPIWARRFGDIGFDIAKSVVIDPGGDIFVSGAWMRPAIYQGGQPFFGGTMDGLLMRWTAQGNPVWMKVFRADASQAHHIAREDDGTLAVTGHFGGTLDIGGPRLVGPAKSNIYFASFSPDGNAISSQLIGAPGANYGYGIASGQRKLVVAGLLNGRGEFCGKLRSATEGGFFGRLR